MTYPRHRATPAGRSVQHPYTVLRRAFKTNQTGTGSITLGVPTTTPPAPAANAGIHELEPGRALFIKPYGTDTNGDEFRLVVELWHPMHDRLEAVRQSEDVVWVPSTALIVDCKVASAAVPAAAAGPLATTDMFSYSMLAPTGTQFQSLGSITATLEFDDIIHSVGDTEAKETTYAVMETFGARYVKFYISVDAGAGTAAASGNVLFGVL